MRILIAAVLMALLLGVYGSLAVSAGDNVPDGNGNTVPTVLIAGDNVPDGNG